MSSRNSKFGGVHRASTSTSTNKADQSGPINIEIAGHRLSIRSDREAVFVQSLARYIDQKVEDLQAAAPTAPMNKLLILASMTVAEELFETREELRQIRREIKDTTQTMFDLIEQAEEA